MPHTTVSACISLGTICCELIGMSFSVLKWHKQGCGPFGQKNGEGSRSYSPRLPDFPTCCLTSVRLISGHCSMHGDPPCPQNQTERALTKRRLLLNGLYIRCINSWRTSKNGVLWSYHIIFNTAPKLLGTRVRSCVTMSLIH